MKKQWIVAWGLAAVLTACGGGGGGGDSSTPSSTSACATGNRSGLVAVGLYGDVGTASVTGGGAQISITAGGSTSSRSLNADSVTKVCADSSGSSTMRTAFTSQGQVGMSHATIASVDQPVFLVDGGTLAGSLAALAGTYNVLRFQKDTPTGGGSPATRSSYATMVVDGSGNWYFCKNTSAACTLGAATGSGTLNLQAGSADRFDLVAGGVTRGTLFLSSNAGSKVLVVGENDAGGAGAVVTGLWVGAAQVAWAANDGNYMLNSTDASKSALGMASQVLTVNGSTIVATVDSPLQGLLTATASGGDQNYIIQTSAGLMVTANNAGNNTGAGPGYFSVGVKP